MSFFSNQKTWFFIALFFLVVNIVLIAGFFMKGRENRHRFHGEMQNFHRDGERNPHRRSFLHASFIADTLNFSAEQKTQLEKIETELNAKKDSVSDLSDESKTNFTKELFSQNPDKNKLDSLMKQISATTEMYNSVRIEKVFRIRALCSKEQLEKFSAIMSSISEKKFHGHYR
jgi:hypothetical protein